MSRLGEALLLAGMLAGLALAAGDVCGLFAPLGGRRPDALAAGVVATVNGRPIRRVDHERALAAVAADRREGAVDAALGRKVLDRLVDEELLVQRGLELGLAERDPSVRSALVAAVLSLYAARSEEGPGPGPAVDPGDGELASFLADNRALFRQPERLRVQRVPGPGEPIAGPGRPGDPPDVLLPLGKLRDYLGSEVTAALARLPAGAVLPPATAAGETWRVLERVPGRDPALGEIRPQVLAEYRRQAGDRRLRAMLDDQRQRADIRIADAPR